MPLSDRQSAAAHRLAQDVCVVAGPGSGKTSVLIERFSWLVRERGIEPSRILAITFTDKAATEIRERLVYAFESLPEVREQIERAWVSTIHAFCARLLRENAIAAGIDPAFTVLDRSLPLLRESADEVLEELYRTQTDRMRRFLRSLAVATERDGYVPDLATSLINIYEAVRLAGGSLDALRLDLPAPERNWARLRSIAAEIAAERPKPNTDKQAAQHAIAREWAEQVLDLPAAIGDLHFNVLSREKNLNRQSLVKNSAAHQHEPEIRELLEQLTRDSLPHFYVAERELIVEVLQLLDASYRRRKRDRSAVDFDDLEEAAIGLLEADPDLRMRVQDSFDFILMDELQDTNPLQWKLMELVRRPANFFAVGDVNQSIYGFRHARPELFSAYRQRLAGAGLAVDELRDNYRSRPEVLSAVNRVFETAPGIEPHTLAADREFPPLAHPSVDVLVSKNDAALDAERAEALWVARRITELVGTLQVTAKDGALRTASFGDVAILTRANYSTADLQRALDDFNIPSVVLGGLTFYDTREVRDLRLLLDVLVNPCNNVALAGLLRSPLFGLSDEDLLRFSSAGSLQRGVEARPPGGWDSVLRLRAIRNVVSPDKLLREFIDERDYESGLTGRARANITKFLSILRERYEAEPSSLAALVAGLDDAAPEAEAPPPDSDDVVRLMTLHKAKGLEFPVVFLPYLHKGRSTGFPIISWSHEHGLGIKWRNPATNMGDGDHAWHANRKQSEAAQVAEENRLLYVGMTRARDHLVLSSSRTGRERGSWPSLVFAGLRIDVDSVTNAEVFADGVRVLTADAPPPVDAVETAAARAGADRFVPRIASVDQAQSSASVTDISRFAECPRRYYLSRYLRWQVAPQGHNGAPAGGVSGSELGVQVHAILAGQPPDDPAPEAVELADRFVVSTLGKQLARAQTKHHEWDFQFDAGDIILRGQIDLWFEYNRDVIIVDYKTDREITPESIAGHSMQLQLYAIALERATGRRATRGVLYFLRSDQQVDVDLTPLAIGGARELVHGFRAAQTKMDFPLRTGRHCFACEFYQGLCPAGTAAAASAD